MILTCEKHSDGIFVYESSYSHTECPVCRVVDELELAEKERAQCKADSDRFESEVGDLTDQIHELKKNS